VIRDGDAVNIVTSARSFLHSQVRSMVGSLVWVGEGRWSADDLAAAWPPETAPPAARSHRPMGCIWCGWIIEATRVVVARLDRATSIPGLQQSNIGALEYWVTRFRG